MNIRQATESDFVYGARFYDKSGNEFIIRDKYDDGIYTTNRGVVIFVSSCKFYTTKDTKNE